jgi:hypothetical protein
MAIQSLKIVSVSQGLIQRRWPCQLVGIVLVIVKKARLDRREKIKPATVRIGFTDTDPDWSSDG